MLLKLTYIAKRFYRQRKAQQLLTEQPLMWLARQT